MLLNLLVKYKTQLAVVAGVALLCAMSYYYGMRSVKPEIVERVEIQEKIVEKVVEVETNKKNEKTKTKTVIVEKPDGTKETTIVEETETEEESTSKKDSESTAEKKQKTDPVAIFPKEKTKYSLGVTARTQLSKQLWEGPSFHYGVELGARIFGLPAWGVAGYEFSTKEVALGFRYEF